MIASLKADTLEDQQSRNVGRYLLNMVQVPKTESIKELSQRSVRHKKNLVVDTESKLRGLDRPIHRFEPHIIKTPQNVEPSSLPEFDAISMINSLEPVGTREKRACNTLSEVTIDRFQYLPENPQVVQNIIFNETARGGMHSRMTSKDSNKC